MHSHTGAPQRRARPLTTAIVVTLLAAACAAATLGAHPDTASGTEPGPIRSVRLERPSPSVRSDGELAFLVATDVEPTIGRIEIRVRVTYPTGEVLYQRTRVFSDVTSPTVRADFGRSLRDLALEEGRYPVQVRVRTADRRGARTGEYVLDDRFLMFDASKPPTPLVTVIRLAQAPSLDPEGRFVDDPGDADASLEAVEAIARMLEEHADLRLSLAAPPALIEQWERVAAGYEAVGPAGVTAVEEGSEVSERHREGLATLAAAVADERLEMLDVPYADPDLAGLASIGAVSDLETHYARGTSVLARALQATPSAGGAFARDILPAAGVPFVAAEGISYAVLGPPSFPGPRGLAGGTWRVEDTTLTALVTDVQLSNVAADADETSTVALDRLFALRRALGPQTPITFVVEFGPGRDADMDTLERFLSESAIGGWARLATAGEAATATARGALVLAEKPRAPSKAPQGYWREIADDRTKALALRDAAGAQDADADIAAWRVMLAESNGWAGPDETWSLVDRGRAFAAAADRSADAVLSTVRLDVSDITLSGSSGKVPIVIANGSGKTLTLELVAEADALDVAMPEQSLSVAPVENYATIGVDLAGGISAPLDVSLRAGDLTIASSTVTVRASVLDRLVIVGAVAVVLVGLLAYIRRRTRGSDVSEDDDVDRIDRGRHEPRWFERKPSRERDPS